MAAPEFVPVKPMDDVRVYASPPRRPDSWLAQRPGDYVGSQPTGHLFGSQGPDQGYALTLARQFDGRLHLTENEHLDDAVHGCVAIGLKRASLFGRAPVVHDLTVAFTVWGFLDPSAPSELVAARRRLFEEVANPHHYNEQRRLVESVPESTLRLPHARVRDESARDWRSMLDLSAV